MAPKATEFGEMTQNTRPLRRSRSFKVNDITDFGTNRKVICDFLLVINTNLPLIALFPSYGCLLVKFLFLFFSGRGVPYFNALARGDSLRISG